MEGKTPKNGNGKTSKGKNTNNENKNENGQGNGQDSNYVTMDMVRELLAIQQSTMLAFFKESISMINERVDNITKDLAEVKSGLTFVGDVFDDKNKVVNEKIVEIQRNVGIVKHEQSNLLPEIKFIHERLIDQDDRSRRNNLRISGLEEGEKEEWKETKSKAANLFKNTLGINDNVIIERAHRVGGYSQNRPRTIVLKLLNYEDKEKILSKASSLKNTNIYINEDYSVETSKLRQELFAQAKEHRSNGKFAKVLYNRLVVKDHKERD